MSETSSTTPAAAALPSRPGQANLQNLALLGLCATALLVRFYALERQSIWYDEANGIRIAMRPLREVFSELTADASPPLYYLILHGWTAWLGQSEFAARALSALAGAALIPLLYLAARRLFGQRTAWTAAGLATLSPFHVYYSQEARMYSLLAALAVLALWTGFQAARTNRWRDWSAFAVACALCAYTHNYGLFVALGAASGALVISGRRREKQIRLGLACLLAALLYLPWLPQALRSQFQGSAITGGWLPPFSLGLITQTVSHLCGMHMFTPAAALFWVGYAAVALAFGGLLLRRRYRRDGTPFWRWQVTPTTAFVATAFGVAAATPLLISILKPIYLPERYPIAFWPAWVLLLAAGLCRLPRPWFLSATAALLITASVGLLGHFGYMQKSGDRNATIFLAEQIQDNDLVVFAPHWTAVAPLYYLKKLPRQTGFPMLTLEERPHHNEALEREPRSLADLMTLLNSHQRDTGGRVILFRLVSDWERDAAQLQAELERTWTRLAAREFPPVAVLIYGPRQTAPEASP